MLGLILISSMASILKLFLPFGWDNFCSGLQSTKHYIAFRSYFCSPSSSKKKGRRGHFPENWFF